MKRGDEHSFRCMIACKVNSILSIKIFDIEEYRIKKENARIRTLSYITSAAKLVVQISDKHEKVIFSNGFEHYILNGNGQDNFPWIKDKFLRNVVNHGEDFYLVTSKDYDRDVDILHSKDKSFNASLKRSIEPNSIIVYDSKTVQIKGEEDNLQTGFLKTIMKIGEFLYVDVIDIKKGKKTQKEQ
jgi:hypothetical protein